MRRELEEEVQIDTPYRSSIAGLINAEHLAMREGVGMVDLSAFAVFDITGTGALGFVQKMTVAQMDVRSGVSCIPRS